MVVWVRWFVSTCATGALLSIPRFEGWMIAGWVLDRLLWGSVPLWGATTGGVLGVWAVINAAKRRHAGGRNLLLLPLGAWGGDAAGAALWRCLDGSAVLVQGRLVLLFLLNYGECFFAVAGVLTRPRTLGPLSREGDVAGALMLVRCVLWWGGSTVSTLVVDGMVGACLGQSLVLAWGGRGLLCRAVSRRVGHQRFERGTRAIGAVLGMGAGCFLGAALGPLAAGNMPRLVVETLLHCAYRVLDSSLLPFALAHYHATPTLYGYLWLGWGLAMVIAAAHTLLARFVVLSPAAFAAAVGGGGAGGTGFNSFSGLSSFCSGLGSTMWEAARGIFDGRRAWLGGTLALGLACGRFYCDHAEHEMEARRNWHGSIAEMATTGVVVLAYVAFFICLPGTALLYGSADGSSDGGGAAPAAAPAAALLFVTALAPLCVSIAAAFGVSPEAVTHVSDLRILRSWCPGVTFRAGWELPRVYQALVLIAPFVAVGLALAGPALHARVGFTPLLLPLLLASAHAIRSIGHRRRVYYIRVAAAAIALVPTITTALALDGYVGAWCWRWVGDGVLLQLVLLSAFMALLSLAFIHSTSWSRLLTLRVPVVLAAFWVSVSGGPNMTFCFMQADAYFRADHWRAQAADINLSVAGQNPTGGWWDGAKVSRYARSQTATARSNALCDSASATACLGALLLLRLCGVGARTFTIDPPRNMNIAAVLRTVRERAMQAQREEQAVRDQRAAVRVGAAPVKRGQEARKGNQREAGVDARQASLTARNGATLSDLWDDPSRFRTQRDFDAQLSRCARGVRHRREDEVLEALATLAALAAAHTSLHDTRNVGRLRELGRSWSDECGPAFWHRGVAKALGRVLREMTAVAVLTKTLRDAREGELIGSDGSDGSDSGGGSGGSGGNRKGGNTMVRSTLSRSMSHEQHRSRGDDEQDAASLPSTPPRQSVLRRN